MKRSYIIFFSILFALPLIFRDNYYILVTGTTALLNACLAISLNLFMGFSGQVSLCHAAFFGIGAYTSAILTKDYGFNPWLCILVGMGITTIISSTVSTPILRLKGHYLAMATLGLGIIIHIFFVQAYNITRGPDGITGIMPLSIFGHELTGEYTWYYISFLTLVLYTWLCFNLLNTRIGRALRAIHHSEIAAQVCGVNTARLKAQMFVISANMASLIGSLLAHKEGFISPESFNLQFSVELLAMIVVGGLGSVAGAISGAIFFTYLPEILTKFHDFEMLFFGLTLMITMIFMPEGLFLGLSKVINKNVIRLFNRLSKPHEKAIS